jgi:endonuclease G
LLQERLYAATGRGIKPLLQHAPPRPEAFIADYRTTARIESQLYSRSDYDRGHMAPNFAIATRYSRETQEETFRMSNISPQRRALNAGVWKTLEPRIATRYPGRFGEVWVFAGPVFGQSPRRLHNRVAVPEEFFMIILDESDGRWRTTAFLFPQETPNFAKPDGYLTTIDEIERRTGLDFLPELPADVQAALESRRPDRAW